MRLIYSPLSPFARKVRILAREARLDLEEVMTNPFTDEGLRDLNPLAKVPTLVADNGLSLYDSAVICQYIDAVAQAGRYPVAGEARWRALALEALCDGLGDAASRAVIEGRRPLPERHDDVIQRQMAAVRAAVTRLAAAGFTPDRFGIGEIAAAAQLSYLDFREVTPWRGEHAGLAAWFDEVSQRDSMRSTGLHALPA
jgi:glutathione S-transferase